MTPPKLSDTDKQSILELYRQPEESTSTLASRYGVSNSTINRVLKQGFSAEEYEALVQQKRSLSSRPLPSNTKKTASAKTRSRRSSKPTKARADMVDPSEGWEDEASVQTESVSSKSAESSKGEKRRRRSSASSKPSKSVSAEGKEAGVAESTAANTAEDRPVTKDLPVKKESSDPKEAPAVVQAAPQSAGKEMPKLKKNKETDDSSLEEMLRADLLDLDDEDDDLSNLDEDDFEDDDEDDDEEDGDEGEAVSRLPKTLQLSVQPLADASLPRTCYLVIDRSAELVTKPLKEFGDLGEVPSSEVQEKTLPIFDNHRVAKRFSNRFQRVIKVPDGRMLQKTCNYLQGKGITRLLIDGQVYSL